MKLTWKTEETMGQGIINMRAIKMNKMPVFTSNDWRSMYWKILKWNKDPQESLEGYEWATKEFAQDCSNTFSSYPVTI